MTTTTIHSLGSLAAHLKSGKTYAVLATSGASVEWLGLADATEVDDLIAYDNDSRVLDLEAGGEPTWIEAYLFFDTGSESTAPVLKVQPAW